MPGLSVQVLMARTLPFLPRGLFCPSAWKGSGGVRGARAVTIGTRVEGTLPASRAASPARLLPWPPGWGL